MCLDEHLLSNADFGSRALEPDMKSFNFSLESGFSRHSWASLNQNLTVLNVNH
jgi:hypothetical protein